MSSTIFDTWDSERWTTEVARWLPEIPEPNRNAMVFLYRDGLSHEEIASRMERHPLEVVVLSVVGIRLIQEHMQLAHATINPPYQRRGSGVPGAPIPTQKAVVQALKGLGPELVI